MSIVAVMNGSTNYTYPRYWYRTICKYYNKNNDITRNISFIILVYISKHIIVVLSFQITSTSRKYNSTYHISSAVIKIKYINIA